MAAHTLVTAADIIGARMAQLRSVRMSVPWGCRRCGSAGIVYVRFRTGLRDVEAAIASQHAELGPMCTFVVRVPVLLANPCVS